MLFFCLMCIAGVSQKPFISKLRTIILHSKRVFFFAFLGLPGSQLSPALERSVKAYNSINRYLSSFVEHAIRDNDYTVKDKLFLEKRLKNELEPPMEKSK